MNTELKGIKRFVCIGAHCDDIELRAGGLFAKLTRQGAEGLYVILVDCSYVRNELRDEIKTSANARNIRRNEAKKGSEILGAAKTVFVGALPIHFQKKNIHSGQGLFYPQFTSYDKTMREMQDIDFTGKQPLIYASKNPEFKMKLRKVIEDWKPDAVFSHSTGDGHPEHNVTAVLVGNIMEESHLNDKIPFFQWRPGSRGSYSFYNPTHFMALDKQDIEIWQRAMECFPSQFSKDSLKDTAFKTARTYGRISGLEYAIPLSLAFFPKHGLHSNNIEDLLTEELAFPE